MPTRSPIGSPLIDTPLRLVVDFHLEHLERDTKDGNVVASIPDVICLRDVAEGFIFRIALC